MISCRVIISIYFTLKSIGRGDLFVKSVGIMLNLIVVMLNFKIGMHNPIELNFQFVIFHLGKIDLLYAVLLFKLGKHTICFIN